MSRHRIFVLGTAACLLGLAISFAPAFAGEHEEEQHAHAEAAEHLEHGDHAFHRHHLSIFLGVTDGEIERHAEAGAESEEGSVIVEDSRVFSVGLDYEYRLNQHWGIGALVDYVGKDRSWVAGIPLTLHPGGSWKLLAAPGFENKDDEDREFLVRLGVMYDFEVGGYTITPVFNVDLVDDEEVLVYGLNIGKGF